MEPTTDTDSGGVGSASDPPSLKGHRGPDAERFQRFIGPPDFSCEYCQTHPEEGGCFYWTGATLNSGYSAFKLGNGKRTTGHRQAFILANPGIVLPPKIQILHRCDERLCVNTRHLFIGNNKLNMIDAGRKKRIYSQNHPERFAGEFQGKWAFLTPGQKEEIAAAVGKTQMELARTYGVPRRFIAAIRALRGKNRVLDTPAEDT